MTNKTTDLENQPQQQHTSSIIKDLDNLQTLSEEELQGVVGGGVADFEDFVDEANDLVSDLAEVFGVELEEIDNI